MTNAYPLPEPLRASSQRTVEKIEIAALRAIELYGRDRFTTQDVATLAGISIGSVYRHFPDRVAILHKVAPIPANVLEALGLLEVALDALNVYPVYEPRGLRKALIDARETLSALPSTA